MFDETPEIVWSPVKGSAQELALSAPCNHILLHGGRGWGKTECQLMRFRRNVGRGYGTYWRGIIFDLEYKNLDDLVTKSKRLFRLFDDKARFLESASQYKWVWPTGEELLFRQAKTESDYWNYHGHEYPYVGWNELTKYPTNKIYNKMLSINRSGFQPSEHTPKRLGHNGGPPLEDDYGNHIYDTPDGKPLPNIPLEVVSTTNPYGPGHNWVKRQFIDAAVNGRILRRSFTVFDAKEKKDITVERTQTAIFGTYRENPYLDPVYIAGLMEETDENILKAWLSGDWDIVAGGALDDKWHRPTHVVPRFKIPKGWEIDRAFDWGSTHPFAVAWFAVSNGEEVELSDGRTIQWPAGTIIMLHEWYGTKEIGTNTGLKMSAGDIAEGIKAREIQLMKQEWISTQPSAGPADGQIANVTEKSTETIAKKMADKGIRWLLADKSKGTRAMGLQLIRDRLEATRRMEGPGLVIMEHCTSTISLVPSMPRDDDDPDTVDTTAEDHLYDVLRYRVLKGVNRTAKVIQVHFPT